MENLIKKLRNFLMRKVYLWRFKPLVCSECFKDKGLKREAFLLGIQTKHPCPNCKSTRGKKLDKSLILTLTHHFFVNGTIHRFSYGAAPILRFNESSGLVSDVTCPCWLDDDIRLLEKTSGIYLFYYGPRLWMCGEIEPLKSLQDPEDQDEIINRIISEYPHKRLTPDDELYRLRVNPKHSSDPIEFDSPPNQFLGRGRLDSAELPVLYCSQDIEGCIHECRVTLEDNLFLATLTPNHPLTLLDLTALLTEKVTEFESLDMAIHMLFFASEHSYEISRSIALSVKKAGYDGLIYPSYFSQARNGAIPFDTIYGISIRRIPQLQNIAKNQVIANLCLFGRPIKEKMVDVKCINRIILKKATYFYHFGPALEPVNKI